MTDKLRKIPGGDISPSSSRFLPDHNSTSVPPSPLVPVSLSVPSSIADKLQPGKGSPTKRVVLTVDDGPNTVQQRVTLKDEPAPPKPGPSIFDPDHSFPVVVIDDTDTPVANAEMETAQNEVTLSDIQNRHQQAIVPRFIAPPIFHPPSGQAVTFLRKFEVATGRNGWDSGLRLTYLGNYLEEAASKWYQAYSNDPAKGSNTWEMVKADFRREFMGKDDLRELQRKLFGRKQRYTESPREYYYDLLEIADEVDASMPFETFKAHFENGLHPSMQDHLTITAEAAEDLPALLRAVGMLQSIHTRMMAKGTGGRTGLTATGRETTGTSRENWTSQGRPSGPRWDHTTQAPVTGSPQSSSSSYGNTGAYPRQDSRGDASSKSGTPGTYRGNNGSGRQLSRNDRRRDNSFIPTTHSRDGRPICQDCNKIGHFTCRRGLPKRGRTTPISAGEEVVLQSACAKILTIVGKLNGGEATPLVIDTGATYTIIEDNIATDIKPLKKPLVLSAVDRFKFTPIGVSIITVQVGWLTIQMPALVGRDVGRPLLFGSDFLCRYNIAIQYDQRVITLQTDEGRTSIPFTLEEPPPLEYDDVPPELATQPYGGLVPEDDPLPLTESLLPA
ncbi:hypothetical protein ABEB36_010707 [Hypothenemus hampei]|uniref:Retrotransposon gag domain-containing protein n=1 Tax=Hypothenemus hampei TaxID=57062 RepID=A0ABD1ED34_HYPHA